MSAAWSVKAVKPVAQKNRALPPKLSMSGLSQYRPQGAERDQSSQKEADEQSFAELKSILVFARRGDDAQEPDEDSKRIVTQFGLRAIGRTEDCPQQFYVITPERKLTHPAVAVITFDARRRLFAEK